MPSHSTELMGNSKMIEDEVMAEIRAALDLPPTSVITIPKLVADSSQESSPRESSTAATEEDEEETERSLYEEEEVEVAVKLKDGGSSCPKHHHQRSSLASFDGSTMNDSFMMKLARSSSSICSSTGISESSSQKYFIGPVDEGEEGSVQTHVSNLGTDDMNHGELMDVVHTLYKELKKADLSLSAEKQRRRSREKNLIKLAKELGKRKEAMNVQLAKFAEMQEELRVVGFEKFLLEQRLEAQMRAEKDVRAAVQKQVDLEVEDVLQKCTRRINEREERITELNRIHANQCEELCREVVEANQEVVRLQKLLADVTCKPSPVDGTIISTASEEDTTLPLSPSPSSNKAARSRAMILISRIVLFGALMYLGYNNHIYQPFMKMTDQFDLYFETFTSHSDVPSPDDTEIDGVFSGRIYSEANEPEIRTTELSAVLSSNTIQGIIFDAMLPLKLLRKGILSKNRNTVEAGLSEVNP